MKLEKRLSNTISISLTSCDLFYWTESLNSTRKAK